MLHQAVLAYLDPGSGSLILQVLAGGVAAAAVSVKLFWRRILTILHIRKPDEEQPSEPPAEADAPKPSKTDVSH